MDDFDWNLFFLRDNPFMISPPDDKDHIVWAGLPSLKKEIDQTLMAAKQTAATQVILNRGPFGGGKTHAMRYYSFQENWPRAKKPVRKTFVFSVSTPKQTGKPAEDFYTDVLERIDMDSVRDAVGTAIQEVGLGAGLARLKEITGSDSIARAICMLGSNDDERSDNGELFEKSGTDEHVRLLDQYFLEGCTKQELKKLGLARNIGKAQDRFRVLAGLIRCFIGLSPGRDIASHNRFCLWVDEMEDFVYFTATQYRPFTQGLRDLIDRVPAFFTLLFNFTLTDPEEFETIEIIMGKALADRVTDNIYFREMTADEAIQYVNDLLAHWRIKGKQAAGLSLCYPFDDEALAYIIKNLEKRTPRSINKKCSKVIESFMQRHKRIKSGQTIDTRFVKTLDSAELRLELE